MEFFTFDFLYFKFFVITRRVRNGFVEGKSISQQDKIQQAMNDAKEELERLQRIKSVTSMYYQHGPFVVENVNKKKK
jgi:hypothetical protein